jgi:hypothetical protein
MRMSARREQPRVQAEGENLGPPEGIQQQQGRHKLVFRIDESGELFPIPSFQGRHPRRVPCPNYRPLVLGSSLTPSIQATPPILLSNFSDG